MGLCAQVRPSINKKHLHTDMLKKIPEISNGINSAPNTLTLEMSTHISTHVTYTPVAASAASRSCVGMLTAQRYESGFD